MAKKTPDQQRQAPPARPSSPPPAEAGEGSGAYMRRLMTLGFSDTQVILDANRAAFPTSKATAADVAFNRSKLAKAAGSPQQGNLPLAGAAAPAAAAPEATRAPEVAALGPFVEAECLAIGDALVALHKRVHALRATAMKARR